MELLKVGNHQLTTDNEMNTQMLFDIPGLSNELTLTIGNAFFIPKSEEDKDKPWNKFSLDIDGEKCLFFTTHTTTPKTVFPCPAVAFTPKGIRKVFEHGVPPREFEVFLLDYLERLYGGTAVEYEEINAIED